MKKENTIDACVRSETGKSNTRFARNLGLLPGVIYGSKAEQNEAIFLSSKSFINHYLKGRILSKTFHLHLIKSNSNEQNINSGQEEVRGGSLSDDGEEVVDEGQKRGALADKMVIGSSGQYNHNGTICLKNLINLKKSKAHEADSETKNFMEKMFESRGDKDQAFDVMIKEIQTHPVKGNPIHVDFQIIERGKPFNIPLYVKVINKDKCPGLKKGGVLNIAKHKVNFMCTLGNVPECLEVDLSGLELGASVRISDVKCPQGSVALAKDNPVLVSIFGRAKEDSAEDAGAASASAGAANDQGDSGAAAGSA